MSGHGYEQGASFCPSSGIALSASARSANATGACGPGSGGGYRSSREPRPPLGAE